MNFQELMSRATQNCNNTMKQRKKSGHLHKDNTSQVSSSAVQAFLARKQQEQQQRQADEDAARRARIEARIEQNLKQKRESKKVKPSDESPVSNQTCHNTNDQEKTQKQRDTRHEKSTTKRESRSSTLKSNKDESRTKHGKEKNINSLTKTRKLTSKPKPAAPNFKELLEMAERNRLGLNKPHNEHSKSHELSKSDKKALKDRLKQNPKKEVQESRDNGKKTKTKELPTTKVTTSKTCSEQRSLTKANKTNYSRDEANNKPRLKRPNPYTTPLQQRGSHKRQYRSYHDDEEEDDMDGFIDDEELDCGGDVSAHIREIFGYDRRRFADDDMDDSAMESSYTQIEREEQRSSKIAKLEDEVAFLKEQAELKREKERLMKASKKKRK